MYLIDMIIQVDKYILIRKWWFIKFSSISMLSSANEIGVNNCFDQHINCLEI